MSYRASANCNAPKVVVMAETWAQRHEFQEAVVKEWKNKPLPVAYVMQTCCKIRLC